MIKKRFISMLVLLAAVVTGAWAEEETLLTTITPTGDGTYSETTVGAVTVTPTGSFFYSGSSYGWRWDSYGSLTVTANEGYTITRCVFIQQGKNQSVTISEAPFALNFEEWLCLENTSMDGVTSIEVYGTAPAAPAGYAVSLKAETADEGNWTAKAGEGEYQSLPLEGVAQGTQVSLKYNGMKKVKSVKAVKKASAEPAGPTTVTWDFSVLSGTAGTGYENGGVKLEACDGEISFVNNQLDAWGNGITITNTLGKKFTSIVIYGEPNSIGINGGGWSNAEDNSSATWTGNSESVHIEEASSAMGITSIVFTLEDAPAPAEGKTYTNLQGGEVLHVGDKITETEGKFRYTHHSNPQSTDYYSYIRSFNTYEVLRANVVYEDYNYKYTESPDGQYYVLKHTYYDDYEEEWFTAYYFNQDLPVTGTSDGITVTLDGQDGSQRNLYTFWVHEPNQ